MRCTTSSLVHGSTPTHLGALSEDVGGGAVSRDSSVLGLAERRHETYAGVLKIFLNLLSRSVAVRLKTNRPAVSLSGSTAKYPTRSN